MAELRLRRVYWIGGGSGAGKTTIAGRLAAEYGLRLYSTDDVMADHARRSSPSDAPFLSQFAAMGMDERWVNRTPEAMLDTFHWFRGEGFNLIVEDLLRMSTEAGIVVEGFRLLPQLVKPLLNDVRHGVWLLPTPAFRSAAFDGRTMGWDIPRKTSDPERARQNLFERDRMFTDRLRAETNRLGLPSIEVSGAMTEEDLVAAVAHTFRLI